MGTGLLTHRLGLEKLQTADYSYQVANPFLLCLYYTPLHFSAVKIATLNARYIVSSQKTIMISALIITASVVGVLPITPFSALAQEEAMMDKSRPHNVIYVGRLSGVQFSGLQAQEAGMTESGAKPDWIQSGRWIARVQSSGEDMTVAFMATIDMLRPDGTAMHQHSIRHFQLSEFSVSEDHSTVVLEGTAIVTMANGPVADVPLTMKFHDESLMELVIGPEKVDGHFGTIPIYGTFTFARTTFLDTGETESKQFSKPEPLPAQAKGPEIPAKGYLVEELRDNLYWVTDGTYNAMFLVGDEGVAAVDAPPSLGQKYLQAIEEVTDKPVKYVIYSHSHLDHIGAATMFPNDATFIAHENVAAELRRAHDLTGSSTLASQLPPVPTVTFTDSYTLDLGNSGMVENSQTLLLDYHGNNHEAGNIFIYAPDQKVLMLVDVVFPGWVPFLELALAKDVAGFVEAHDIALGYDFDTYVGGHLTRLGTRADVETQQEFVSGLIMAAGRANGAVRFADVERKVGPTNDTWAFFRGYVEMVNEECTRDMLSKWVGRLGGAEAVMESHCWTMTEAMRVDPSVAAMSQGQQ